MRICPILKLGVWLALGIGASLAPFGCIAEQNNDQCFFLRQWSGTWTTAPDAHSIYIRLDSGQVYQLELDGSHPTLKNPFAKLSDRDSVDAICSPIDFHLILSDRLGMVEGLIVRKMTPLTPSQVKALPRNLRP